MENLVNPELLETRRWFDCLSALNFQKKTLFLRSDSGLFVVNSQEVEEIETVEKDILIYEAALSGFMSEIVTPIPYAAVTPVLIALGVVSQTPQKIDIANFSAPVPFPMPIPLKNEIVTAFPGANSGVSQPGPSLTIPSTGIYFNEIRKYEKYPMPINKGTKLYLTYNSFAGAQPILSLIFRYTYIEIP